MNAAGERGGREARDVLFLGVGKMGLPMARHLRAAGVAVRVHDPDAARLALAREAGLAPVTDLPAALASSMWVMSSLPHDAALREVGALVARHAPAGARYADTSTVSLAASAEVAAACAARGIDCLRVTVSGNNHMAEAAQLTVMASGPRAAYDAFAPWLACLGPACYYLGEAEQARLMKLVINLMIAQTSAMLAEALTLGTRGGLAWRDLWQVIGASAVGSPIVRAKSEQLARHDYTPTFTVEQMLKDLGLILEAGQALHAPLPQTAQTRESMQAAMAQGRGGEDYATIIRVALEAARALPRD